MKKTICITLGAIVGLFLIVGIAGLVRGNSADKNDGSVAVVDVAEAPEVKAPEEPVKTEAVIVSVGDIFLHTNNLSAAFDAKTKTYNFDSAFSATAHYFKDADVSTAWLGGVMDTKGPYTGYPSFRSPVALVDTLQKIGLDVVYRTNHTLDFGTKGFNTTSQVLADHKIAQIAAHTTEATSKDIYVYQKDDLKIAFVGYIYGMNGIPIPKPWMVDLIDLKKIKSDIQRAHTQADFVVVALHFGNEYERTPNAWQKDTAQKIADFGADMIIGSHPHVLQPVDRLTTKDGRKVVVAYGLGNYYCGQRVQYTDEGVILRYVIEKTGNETKLKEIKYIPTWVAEYKVKGRTQYQVLPSQEYIKLYKEGKASFLSANNFKRLQATYFGVVKHLNNPAIGFTQY